MTNALRSFLAVVALGLLSFPAFAQDPPLNPNGFPSGDHFNLNILGKKADFVCPPEPYEPGNVVFVLEQGTGDILLKSGSGRKSTGYDTFQVTDPCISAFDLDPAVVEIPPAPDGYWVYARALAKLTDNPSMKITPGVVTVSSTDETLVYLGYVTSNGFYNALGGITVTRVKGKHPAIPLNGLFDWQGYVCYDVDPATFGSTETYTQMDQCLIDTNLDGVLDTIAGQPSGGICEEGTLVTGLYCTYYDTDWVFNIADFVDYLWGIDNSGAKLVQIRFYAR